MLEVELAPWTTPWRVPHWGQRHSRSVAFILLRFHRFLLVRARIGGGAEKKQSLGHKGTQRVRVGGAFPGGSQWMPLERLHSGNTMVDHWCYRGTMIKTLVRHGNSYALVIDRPILELLNISPDTPLEISTSDGKSLTLTPAARAAVSRVGALTQSLGEINTRYGKTLERLAK